MVWIYPHLNFKTNYKTKNRPVNNEPPKYKGETEFWQLNFQSDDVSWDTINKAISKIPWKTLFRIANINSSFRS